MNHLFVRTLATILGGLLILIALVAAASALIGEPASTSVAP